MMGVQMACAYVGSTFSPITIGFLTQKLGMNWYAKKMLRVIEKKKWESYIGGRETSGIYLKRFLPKVLHRVVLRSKVV